VLPDGEGTSLLPFLRHRGIPALVMSGLVAEHAPELVSWRMCSIPKTRKAAPLANTIRELALRRERNGRGLPSDLGEAASCGLHGGDVAA
jgi:hypothetical protein